MKRTQKLVTWGIVLLVVLVVMLMLASNLRRSSRVILPDTSAAAEDSTEMPAEGGALTVVEVTPETVQAAIATLSRPETYRRSVTVEYLWSGGSGTIEMVTSVSGGWTRIDRTLPDGQTRHTLTDSETAHIWYNEEKTVYSGAAGEISADVEQLIPTYEDVLALPAAEIAQADYRAVSDVRCIYVETAEDAWGYVQRYWVSVDTGLLVVAERLQDGETVYRMASLTVEQAAPTAELFILPDGTELLGQ